MDKLANEYQKTTQALEERLQTLRAAQVGARGAEAFSLERRIDALQQELWQTEQIADWIAGYYQKAGRPRR